jgi:hypothetical protein
MDAHKISRERSTRVLGARKERETKLYYSIRVAILVAKRDQVRSQKKVHIRRLIRVSGSIRSLHIRLQIILTMSLVRFSACLDIWFFTQISFSKIASNDIIQNHNDNFFKKNQTQGHGSRSH